MPNEAKERIEWVYSSPNAAELGNRYDVWARDYEADLACDNYCAPEVVAELFTRYVPREACVLDAGAGTGLVGSCLRQQGYRHIEALDVSPGMLREANKKKAYAALHQGILGETLDLPTDFFGAVISVGTFTFGHASSKAFPELIRVTQPGGYVVFTIRPDHFEHSDFGPAQTALETAGKWTLVERGEPFLIYPNTASTVKLQVWVYQIEAER